MSRALRGVNTRKTSQSRPIPGSSQVENSAGGFAWEVDKWERLHRFLILGTEGGTYYINERKLTEDNAQALIECVAEDGVRTVLTIGTISVGGRAPKNDQALFALAYCLQHGDVNCRRKAANMTPQIARTGTHLFMLAEFLEQFGGWGPVKRRAFANWYLTKSSEQLAYQLVKYRQRGGWSHRDILRLAHPQAEDPDEVHNELFRWVTQGDTSPPVKIIEGYEHAKRVSEGGQADKAKDSRTADLIRNYGLSWEMVPTERLNSPVVMEALLESMPVMATMRQLPKLTKMGLIGATRWDLTEMVAERLLGVKGAKVHPMQVLVALKTYGKGHGIRGQMSWTPVEQIEEALDSAFYKAFDNVEPTGKTIVLGLDVSGSMGAHHVMDGILSAREAATAMAMVTARVEPRCITLAFTDQLAQFRLKRNADLAGVIEDVSRLPFGRTDCALPMIGATQQGAPVDCFQIYTDNETWYGDIHPKQALDEHRRKLNANAKSVVVAVASNGFSIADPNDPGMLDVVGFDTTVPAVMADFVR